MKIAACSLAGLATLGLALTACTTVYQSSPPAKSHSASAASPSSGAPSSSAPATGSPQAAPPASAAAPAAPNVTDPWAVVSAYYGDIESGDYQNAWQLLDSGMTTGQTYQQFVDGFNCTGSPVLSRNWESGDEVNFDLAATDD